MSVTENTTLMQLQRENTTPVAVNVLSECDRTPHSCRMVVHREKTDSLAHSANWRLTALGTMSYTSHSPDKSRFDRILKNQPRAHLLVGRMRSAGLVPFPHRRIDTPMTDALPGMDRPVESRSLAELALAIKADHRAFEAAGRTTLAYMQRVGNLLSEVKRVIGHGMLTAWVHKNCSFSPACARRYMRAHRQKIKTCAAHVLEDQLAEAFKDAGEEEGEDNDAEGVASADEVDGAATTERPVVTIGPSGGSEGASAKGKGKPGGGGSTGGGRTTAPVPVLSKLNRRVGRVLTELDRVFEEVRIWLGARGHVDDALGHAWIRLGGHVLEEIKKTYEHSRSADAKEGKRLRSVGVDPGKALLTACARVRNLMAFYVETDAGRHLTDLAGRGQWLSEVEAKLKGVKP